MASLRTYITNIIACVATNCSSAFYIFLIYCYFAFCDYYLFASNILNIKLKMTRTTLVVLYGWSVFIFQIN